MHAALIRKEIRETGWLGLIAMVMLGFIIAPYMGVYLFSARLSPPDYIPFVESTFPQMLTLVGSVLALALGYWQTLGESLQKTWLYLLHRPVARKDVVIIKLVTGLCLLLVMTGLPVAIYFVWATIPGTHPSPFEWWFSTDEWRLWLMTPSIYLAAFLSGLREARWFVSRLLPLPGPIFLVCIVALAIEWPWILFSANLAVCVLLVVAIFQVAQEEDFS